jgi:hypothetical protein
MRSFVARFGLALGFVAALGLGPLTASAAQPVEGPTLVVANPSPGNMLTPGKLIMEGVAFDTLATEGVGIDRVSVFLENRDAGGAHLGDAALGAPNIMGTQSTQFASAGWTITTPALEGYGDGHTIFVYARSAVTGAETVMQIPVIIGEKPKQTGPTLAPALTEPAPEPAPAE